MERAIIKLFGFGNEKEKSKNLISMLISINFNKSLISNLKIPYFKFNVKNVRVWRGFPTNVGVTPSYIYKKKILLLFHVKQVIKRKKPQKLTSGTCYHI